MRFVMQNVEELKTGVVKWFSNSKGFGFIHGEDDNDIFVHYSVIESEGYRTLQEGDRVSFKLSQGEKGLQASYVKKII